MEGLALRTIVAAQVGASSADFELLRNLSHPLYRLERRRQDATLVPVPSLCADFLNIQDAASDDDFQTEVAKKSSQDLLGRQEAEREAVVDRLIKQQGGKEKALLHVVNTDNSTEPKVLLIVNTLLNRRANPSAQDEDMKTPLHYATEKGFADVVRELLLKGARPDLRDSKDEMPVHLAVSVDDPKDDIAALLLLAMPHELVRALFTVADNDIKEKAELSLHDLIRSGKMQQTVLEVLNCMMDPIGQSSSVRVYYHILDADEKGRSPHHKQFDGDSRSCLRLMSKGGHKDLVYHDVVRLLMKRKWTGFARKCFLVNAAFFVLFQLTVCLAAVLACMTDDPRSYSGGLQVFRGVLECVSILAIVHTFLLELNQIRKHKKEYVKDIFHWLSLLSSLSLMAVVPLRWADRKEQWLVSSIGFLLWNLRLFKFAYAFRTMGAYSQILGRIVRHDFPQFLWVFAIILVAFSGSFVLALRGEDLLHVHEETSTFWDSMFTGVRILIEGQPVLEYYGPDGYKGLSCFLMVLFLGTCCVVLLNILIAQLSDTYHNVQSDAHRGLELNRAWIITRTELHSIYHQRFRKPHRITRYKPYEDIQNPKEVLKKWDNPPLSEINRHVRDIKDMHESHSVKLRNINKRLKRQEEQLKKIMELLSTLSRTGVEPVQPENNSGNISPYLPPLEEDREEDINDDVGMSDSDFAVSVA